MSLNRQLDEIYQNTEEGHVGRMEMVNDSHCHYWNSPFSTIHFARRRKCLKKRGRSVAFLSAGGSGKSKNGLKEPSKRRWKKGKKSKGFGHKNSSNEKGKFDPRDPESGRQF